MTDRQRQRMRSPAFNRRLVARFNLLHPVGTPVLYRPVLEQDETRLTRTREPAWMLGDHNAVVMVEGVAGCVSLWHVEVAPAEEARP